MCTVTYPDNRPTRIVLDDDRTLAVQRKIVHDEGFVFQATPLCDRPGRLTIMGPSMHGKRLPRRPVP
jgi:hypothetical protein